MGRCLRLSAGGDIAGLVCGSSVIDLWGKSSQGDRKGRPYETTDRPAKLSPIEEGSAYVGVCEEVDQDRNGNDYAHNARCHKLMSREFQEISQ